jgi:general stress protein 26
MNAIEITEMLLNECRHCVLATATKMGKPEVSFMRFVRGKKWEIFFQTFKTYRKWKNIQENPIASVSLYQKPSAVQMDGIIVTMENEELGEFKKAYAKKHEGDTYTVDPNAVFFKFVPNWIRVRMPEHYPPKFEVILDKEGTK